MSLRDKFKEFSDNIGDTFKHTKDYIETKAITKTALILVAGVTMSGCNILDSDFTSAAKQFESAHPEEIIQVNAESVKNIAEGQSGVYKSEGNNLLFLSNYDENEAMTTSQQIAMNESIPEPILSSPNSFHKSSLPIDPIYEKLYHHSASYIHIEKDELQSEFNKVMKGDLEIAKDDGINKFVALHEFSHYLTKDQLKNPSGEYDKERLNEFAGDTLAIALYAKIYDKSLEEYTKITQEIEEYREGNSRMRGHYGHFTVIATSTMQHAFEKDPSMFEKMKSLSVEQIADIHIYAVNNIPQVDIDKAKVPTLEDYRIDIRNDLEGYKETGTVSKDSDIFKDYKGYENKYEKLIEHFSSETVKSQDELTQLISTQAFMTKILVEEANALTGDHPSIEKLNQYIENTYNQNNPKIERQAEQTL